MPIYVKRRAMSEDELMHWKYIKKYRKNGKWIYFYDDSELKKYKNNLTTTTVMQNDKDMKRTTTTNYRKSNKLFSKTTGIRYYGSRYDETTRTKTQGKLERAYAKAEKFVYDKVYSKRSSSQSTNNLSRDTIDQGVDWIKNRLSIK